MSKINNLNLRYIKVRQEDKQGISMTNVIVTKETIRIDLDQTVGIEEFHLVVGYHVDEITEIDQDISINIEMTLEEVISGEM